MKILEYPFDSEYILKKKKSIRKELMNAGLYDVEHRVPVKIAVLGGSTTHDIVTALELFLLNAGIAPVFYESEYAMYWQDVMFDNPELVEFAPDLIFIHTSFRNIKGLPTVRNTKEEVDVLLEQTVQHYEAMWARIEEKYHCPVIQNNFEAPFYRLLGNKDVVDYRGAGNFVHRLNEKFYEYAQCHSNFYINDINYMAACYGLQKWSDPFYWHMYKYAVAVPAIPEFAYNLANIIKAIYGKNKKALVLDLDNTLWGGIVGDDGETHNGIYDTAFFNGIPNITVYSPAYYCDLNNALVNCLYHSNGPCVIRYPRGAEPEKPDDYICDGRLFSVLGDEDADIAIVTYGRIFADAYKAMLTLKAEGKKVKLIKLNVIVPVPVDSVFELKDVKNTFFFEEGVKSGGVGEHFAMTMLENEIKSDFCLTAFPDCFVKQGKTEVILNEYNLDCDGMLKVIRGIIDEQ